MRGGSIAVLGSYILSEKSPAMYVADAPRRLSRRDSILPDIQKFV